VTRHLTFVIIVAVVSVLAVSSDTGAGSTPPPKQIAALKRQITALQTKNATLRQRIVALVRERDSFKGQVAALQTQIASALTPPPTPALPELLRGLDARQIFLTVLPIIKHVFDQERETIGILAPFSASHFDGTYIKSYSFSCSGSYAGSVCSP
jgi:hypothetical protein